MANYKELTHGTSVGVLTPLGLLTAAFALVCITWTCSIVLSWETPTLPIMIPLKNSMTVDPLPNGRCLSCFKWKFPFSISPQKDLCYLPNGQKIDLIIVVPTKHENTGHRNLLREVFDSSRLERRNVRVLFAFGKHPKALNEMEIDLQLEAQQHGDVLQVDVIGSYRNSTLLAYNAFNWVAQSCLNARFVLKTTDDVIFNVPGILKLLDMKGDSELLDVVFGLCGFHAPVVRGSSSKWAMSKTAYPFKYYPAYCGGPGFFFSTHLLQDFLLKETENMAFATYIDDLDVGINLRLTDHCVCRIPYLYFMHGKKYMALAKASSPTNCTAFQATGPFLGVHLHGQSLENIKMFWTLRHCYEQLMPSNKTISAIKCRRQGECPQDYYHIKGIKFV